MILIEKGYQVNYDKVWEVMSNLEEAFNKIATIEFMAEELNEAIIHNDMQKIIDISAALTAYLPVYTTHYREKASLCVWNNTVLEVKKDQQCSSATPQDGNIDLYTKSYEEIKDSLMELESLGIKC